MVSVVLHPVIYVDKLAERNLVAILIYRKVRERVSARRVCYSCKVLYP